MRARVLHADARTLEPFDCFLVEGLGHAVFAEEGAAPSFDPEPPVSAAGLGRFGYQLEGGRRALTLLPQTSSRLDQLGHRPDCRTVLWKSIGLAYCG